MTTISTAVSTLLPTLDKRQPTVVPSDEKASKSGGYLTSGKVTHDGSTYQVNVAAWLIKSKATGEQVKDADPKAVTDALAAIVAAMGPKTFSTGKTGYFGQGKVVIGDQRFQASAQAVKIG